MPRDPKIFYHDSIHFVTTSVEEGFMFPPNPLVNELLKKSLAQAQALHPVGISDILCNSTHAHFFLQVIDPQDAADFMERFKCESAHAINRLLGRKKKTIWCEGYDSPLIQDLPTAIDRIAYIYENPAKDNLVESIEQYPGFNTFRQRKGAAGKARSVVQYETRRIARSDLERLPEGKILTTDDYRRIRRKLIHKKPKANFEVDIDVWMESLGVTTEAEKRKVSRAIVAEVKAREEKHSAQRRLENKIVLGSKKLSQQPIGTPYTPKRTGKKMLTHSVDKELRKETIRWMRELIQRGKECLARWREGEMTVPYPLGLFPPTGVRLAEPICW